MEEISRERKMGKKINTWRLNNMLLKKHHSRITSKRKSENSLRQKK